MSGVLKSQRKESKTNFLEDINNAYVHSVKKIERLPKKLATIKNKMYDMIFDAHTLIYEGNSIYPTNLQEARLRILKLVEAKAKLYAFLRSITALKEITDINTSSCAYWSEMIKKSIDSLGKIIRANRRDYSKRFGSESANIS